VSDDFITAMKITTKSCSRREWYQISKMRHHPVWLRGGGNREGRLHASE